mmetsp:Transcript_15517/g.29037  ORF Transcript_15517/g.29037 Transcript_15517/m.29037 type:complete len:718 (-) Transcript_15517:56-2209(-)
MELRVEAADGYNMPNGCFVGVRVGDILKQGKYDPACCYRFPAVERQRSAKIDLYQHVGTCCAFVDSDFRSNTEVRVSCMDPRYTEMRLKVHTKPSNNSKQREVKKMEVKKQAREYLGKHHIEERLSEAVKALLSSQPENPTEFLCQHLRSTCPDGYKPAAAPVAAAKATAAPVEPSKKFEPAQGPAYTGSTTAGRPVQAAPQGNLARSLPATREVPKLQAAKAGGELQKFTALKAGELLCDSGSPEGRGVFTTEARDLAVWVNDGNHVQFLIQPKAGADGEALSRLERLEGILAEDVKQDGYEYGRVGAPQAVGQLLKLEGNLRGLGLPSIASVDELREAERILTRAFLECSGDFEGSYLPISGNTSYVPTFGNEVAKDIAAKGPALAGGTQAYYNSYLSPRMQGEAWNKMYTTFPSARTAKSSTLQIGRNLRGLRQPAYASQEELVEVERIVAQVLSECSGEFAGEYLPLPGSISYPSCPGGMSEDAANALRNEGLLYKFRSPQGRGLFATETRDMVVWVNDGCHAQFLVQPQGNGAAAEAAAWARLELLEGILADAVKQDGYAYDRVGGRQTAGPLLKLEGSLRGLCSPTSASVDELCEAERVLAQAFSECSGDLEGVYFPLRGSTSYVAMSGGMPEYDEAALRSSGMLFELKGPAGCGIFTNDAKDFAVWVNEGCHIQILVKPRGGNPEQDAQRLKFVQDTLEDALRQSGYAFA